jgi:hypothetical protein
MLALLDIEGVVGFKFTEWNLFFMKRVLSARTDITIFNPHFPDDLRISS